MATVKKPAKAATKKAKAAHKIGDRVKVVRRDGTVTRGVVKGTYATPTGSFVSVELSVPTLIDVRPSKIKAA